MQVAAVVTAQAQRCAEVVAAITGGMDEGHVEQLLVKSRPAWFSPSFNN